MLIFGFGNVVERNRIMILFSLWHVHLWPTIYFNSVNKKITEILSSTGRAVILFILFKDFLRMECHQCKVDTSLQANCANLGTEVTPMDVVPPDLGPNIVSLDLSNNVIQKINEESFKNYKNLDSLLLYQTTILESISDRLIFRPLEQLTILNMSNFYSRSKLNYYWPLSLKTLDVSNSSRDGKNLLDVSHLIKLKILDARADSLLDIPSLNQLAPIKFLDLRFNPLNDLTVENLAKYCNIYHMEILLDPNSYLSEQPFYCTCIKLNEWFKVYSIKSENGFKCWENGTGSKNVRMKDLPYPACDPGFSKVALENRIDCLQKSSNIVTIISIIIGSIVFIIFLLSCIAYKYGMLQKKLDTGELELVDKKSSDESKPKRKVKGNLAGEEAEEEETGN